MNRTAMILMLVLLIVILPGLAAEEPGKDAKPAGPVMKLVQTVKVEAPEGAKAPGLSNVRVHGGFVYARDRSRLLWWKRAEDGQLAEAGKLAEGADGVAYRSLLFVGGRLYSVRLEGKWLKPRKVYLVWYDVDAQTGKPAEAGRLAAPASSPSVSYEPLQASPDGKSIYLLAAPRRGKCQLVHFSLGADGKATLGGSASGKGIGASAKPIGDSTMAISPDGKHIYTISANDHALGIVKCGEDGAPTLAETVDLNPLVADPNPESQGWNQTFCWPAVAISPDGKHLYVNLWSYNRKHGNCMGLYRRDAETGKLELVGKMEWPAAPKGMRMGFTRDGKSGCFGGLNEPVTQLKRDPEAGKLTKVIEFPKTSGPERRGPCLYDMTLDESAGYAYFTDIYGALFVFKMPG